MLNNTLHNRKSLLRNRKNLFCSAVLTSIFVSSVANADIDRDALSLDRVIPEHFELAFPNERNIRPEQSDFKVQNFALMSNEYGERWAVVTLSNMAKGRRTLTQQHLMALTANGKRIAPEQFSQTFKANETLSLTINFGESKFPILTIDSRTQ